MANNADIQTNYLMATKKMPARKFINDHPAGSTAANFDLVSDYQPAGDQPQAIKDLVSGLTEGDHDQVLLGVTGS